VRSIFGPRLSGGGLDMDGGNRILTASDNDANNLQLWDFRTGKALFDVPWQCDNGNQPRLMCCKFSPCGTMLAAGGIADAVVKVFDAATFDVLSEVTMEPGVYDLQFTHKTDGMQLAIGGMQNQLKVFDIV
jgi:WD40 repeat protein